MKLYVIVRKDIPKTWYTPQACHAVAQFALDHPEKHNDWQNRNIVVLFAKDFWHLSDAQDHLKEMGVDFSEFVETYDGFGLTAIAFTSEEPIPAFHKLPLLS